MVPRRQREQPLYDDGERDYLDALDVFITGYDQKHVARRDARSPVDRLKGLVQESEVTPTQLAKLLECSQTLVSLILNGKRDLSKSNIRRLADHFKISPAYFL